MKDHLDKNFSDVLPTGKADWQLVNLCSDLFHTLPRARLLSMVERETLLSLQPEEGKTTDERAHAMKIIVQLQRELDAAWKRIAELEKENGKSR